MLNTLSKKNKEQIIEKHNTSKPNLEYVGIVFTLTCKPTFFTPTLKNIIRL